METAIAAIAIALAGFLAGQTVLVMARRREQDMDLARTEGRTLPLQAVALTPVAFTGAVAYLHASVPLPTPALWSVGVVCGAVACSQGLIGAAVLPHFVRDLDQYGRSLVVTVLPESLAIFALALAVLATDGEFPHWVWPVAGASLGASAFIQALIVRQGDLARRLPAEGFGALVIAMALAEVPGVVAFVAALMAFG